LVRNEYKEEEVDSITSIIERCFESTPEARGYALKVLKELELIFERLMKQNPQASLIHSQELQNKQGTELMFQISKNLQEMKMNNMLKRQPSSELGEPGE
jgi:hypothetical protein